MSVAGALRFDLAWDGRAVHAVDVVSTRALLAGRLLQGKAAWEAAGLVPMLFSLCSRAQAAAAAAAVDAALGNEPSPARARRQELLVTAEAVQEYLWRVLLDLPSALGHSPEAVEFGSVRRRLSEAVQRLSGGGREGDPALAPWREVAAELASFLAARVYGMPLAEWPGSDDLDALESWLRAGATPTARHVAQLWDSPWGASEVALMPANGRADLVSALGREALADAEFCRRPVWRGEPLETGALTRIAGHALLKQVLDSQGGTVAARVMARLVELASLALRLDELAAGAEPSAWLGSVALGEEAGAGWSETARGLLVHAVQLERGRVVGYAMVAPTEWNFHPEGPLVKGLIGAEVAAESELRSRAAMLVQALDPCVAYHVEVRRA